MDWTGHTLKKCLSKYSTIFQRCHKLKKDFLENLKTWPRSFLILKSSFFFNMEDNGHRGTQHNGMTGKVHTIFYKTAKYGISVTWYPGGILSLKN